MNWVPCLNLRKLPELAGVAGGSQQAAAHKTLGSGTLCTCMISNQSPRATGSFSCPQVGGSESTVLVQSWAVHGGRNEGARPAGWWARLWNTDSYLSERVVSCMADAEGTIIHHFSWTERKGLSRSPVNDLSTQAVGDWGVDSKLAQNHSLSKAFL